MRPEAADQGADPEGVAQGTARPPHPVLCRRPHPATPPGRGAGGRGEPAPLPLVPPPPRPSRAGLCVGSSGPALGDNLESPRATAPGVCMTLERTAVTLPSGAFRL